MVFDDTTVTLAFTRGSTTKFLPVNLDTVLISARISACFKFSVIKFSAANESGVKNSPEPDRQQINNNRKRADALLWRCEWGCP